ncbi:MAG: ferritin-like domain-containing protein [Anaerolineae bacterium]
MRQKTRRFMVAGWVLAMVAALTLPTVVAAAGGPPESRGRGMGLQAPVAGGELDAGEQAVLTEFLVDEHKALATYEAVMAEFGEIAPFAQIARAERQHIAALERVFERYDVALPEIPDFDVPSFDSPEAAAEAAAQAEIDNAALYDRRLGEIDNDDVVRVATNLRDASLNNHLPAFQAFAEGTYTAGAGVTGEARQAQAMQGGVGGVARGFGRGMTDEAQAVRQRLMDESCPAYEAGGGRGR